MRPASPWGKTVVHFWRGKITSEKQANRIVRWTGWLFATFTIVPMLEGRFAPIPANVGLVIAALSMFLLWRRSRFAAGLLFALAAFMTVCALLLSIIAAWYEVTDNSYGYITVAGPLYTAWFALGSLLTWRALQATIAWHKLIRPQSSGDAARLAEQKRPLGPPWIR